MRCVAGNSCPLCYVNRRGREGYKGHRFYRPPVRLVMSLQKPVPLGDGTRSPVGHSFADSAVPTLFPTLWCFLADVTWSDGSRRMTSTVNLFVEDGMVKLCLSDRDGGKTAWSTGPTLEAAATALESRLTDGTAEWRSKSAKGSGGRPRG